MNRECEVYHIIGTVHLQYKYTKVTRTVGMEQELHSRNLTAISVKMSFTLLVIYDSMHEIHMSVYLVDFEEVSYCILNSLHCYEPRM